MSLRKLVPQAAAAIFGIVFVASAGMSDECSTHAQGTRPMFTVTVEKCETAGDESVQQAVITVGTNQFLMAVPAGLRMETSPDKIVISPSDYSYHLVFRMTGTPAANASKAESCRAMILNRYPGAKVVEEYSLTAAGRTGPAFDLLWTPPGVSERFVRVALISSPVGILEFSMIADSTDIADGQFNFKGLIRGFRSNENGKLEIVRLSDNS